MIFKAQVAITHETNVRVQCKELLISCPDWESAAIAAETHYRKCFAEYKLVRITVFLTSLGAPLGEGVLEENEHFWKEFVY